MAEQTFSAKTERKLGEKRIHKGRREVEKRVRERLKAWFVHIATPELVLNENNKPANTHLVAHHMRVDQATAENHISGDRKPFGYRDLLADSEVDLEIFDGQSDDAWKDYCPTTPKILKLIDINRDRQSVKSMFDRDVNTWLKYSLKPDDLLVLYAESVAEFAKGGALLEMLGEHAARGIECLIAVYDPGHEDDNIEHLKNINAPVMPVAQRLCHFEPAFLVSSSTTAQVRAGFGVTFKDSDMRGNDRVLITQQRSWTHFANRHCRDATVNLQRCWELRQTRFQFPPTQNRKP